MTFIFSFLSRLPSQYPRCLALFLLSLAMLPFPATAEEDNVETLRKLIAGNSIQNPENETNPDIAAQLNELTLLTARKNNDNRKTYANELLTALEKSDHYAMRLFYLNQLRIAGDASFSGPLSAYFNDDSIGERAIQVCIQWKADIAEKLTSLYPQITNEQTRITIVRHLGNISYTPAADTLFESMDKTRNIDLRSAVRNALARMGDERALESLNEDADITSASPQKRKRLFENTMLVYGQTVALKGNREEACFLAECVFNTSHEPQLIAKAFSLYMQSANKERQIAFAKEALNHADIDIQAKALEALPVLNNELLYQAAENRFKTVPNKIMYIHVLSEGKRTAILPDLEGLFSKEDYATALAAMQGYVKITNDNTAGLLMSKIKDDWNNQALETVLMSSKELYVAPLLACVQDESKNESKRILLLEIIADKRIEQCLDAFFQLAAGKNAKLKAAALKNLYKVISLRNTDSVITQIKQADGSMQSQMIAALARAARETNQHDAVSEKIINQYNQDNETKLLVALAKNGGSKAIDFLASKSSTGVTEASSALLSCDDPEAIPALIRIASDAAVTKALSLAFQENTSTRLRQSALSGSLPLLNTTEAKVLFFNTLVKLPRQLAIRAIQQKDGNGKAYENALSSVRDQLGNATVSAAISLLPDENGYCALFNEKDFEGWHFSSNKDKHPWVWENGVLICKSHSYLVSDYPYGNFELSFETSFTENSNNGIGFRAKGNAINEIQILDDEGSWHKGQIHDYQLHGSLYGIMPAKSGTLKQLGEWNSMVIKLEGRHCTVISNGTTIVDGNMDDALREMKKHADHSRQDTFAPLTNDIGDLMFMGHDGPVVKFRNIRIKNLDKPDLP